MPAPAPARNGGSLRGLWGEASVTKSALGPAGGFPRDPSYAARGLQHINGVKGTPE